LGWPDNRSASHGYISRSDLAIACCLAMRRAFPLTFGRTRLRDRITTEECIPPAETTCPPTGPLRRLWRPNGENLPVWPPFDSKFPTTRRTIRADTRGGPRMPGHE